MTDKEGFLDHAYGLSDAERTRIFYGDWASTYDAEVAANGYVSPGRVAAAMADHVTDLSRPLLDLGCGTGVSGQALKDAGFTTIDGSDFSPEMLEAAKTKGLYRMLTLGDLARPIPAEAGDYANITAIGVFSPGHAPADMIENVLALLPIGGCFGFTLNDHALEEAVYEARIEQCVSRGEAEVVFDAYGPHMTARKINARVYVLRRK